jgi:hypothetical protein
MDMVVTTQAVAWWGYAEGNPTIVAIVVVLVAVSAVAYVVRRFWKR